MTRTARAQLAAETVEILHTGCYNAPSGRTVAIGAALSAACEGTQCYTPTNSAALLAALPPATGSTTIRVTDCTTLAAGRELAATYPRLACLNFASAKHPGGGFLGGSQAQEESLARSSGLYATLQTQPEFYRYHAQRPDPLYSDHIIWSPAVPVFRDDSGALLEQPWQTAFLTAAAVNAGVLRQRGGASPAVIGAAMLRRTRLVLAVAAHHGCAALVLGAWGCGVFQNDPAQIAALFAEALREPAFAGRFEHIEFAVYDPSTRQATLRAFEQVLGGQG